MSPETFLYIAGTAITVLATAVLPLYIKLRNAQLELKAKTNATQIEIDNSQIALAEKKEVNAAAEFKRILEFRDAETQRLRDRDERQEKQVRDLWDKYVAALERGGRLEEQLKAVNEAMTKSDLRWEEQLKVVTESMRKSDERCAAEIKELHNEIRSLRNEKPTES